MYNNSENDDPIIEAVKKGDCDAYAPLVERYKLALYRVMYRMVMNRDDAEDLVEEAFIKAYRSIGRFKTGRPFYPWLRRIAVNNALNFIKRERRVFVQPLEYAEGKLSDGRNDPVTMAREKMLAERITSAFARLPEDARVILSLKVEQDLSYDEIGRMLRIPRGTVMSRLARARVKLRKLMEEKEAGKNEVRSSH